MIRDPLLNCINELANSLELEIELNINKYIHLYEDVNLGTRAICSVCGRTFNKMWKECDYLTIHQDSCRIGKAIKLIHQARTYTNA